MQAIKPDLNVSAPPDSAQSSFNSRQSDAQGTDFKKTLQDTDEKIVRKSASHKSDVLKNGKHQPDSGNDLPASPVPVAASVVLIPNLTAVGGPITGASTSPIDESASWVNAAAVGVAPPGTGPLTVVAPGAKAVAVTDADQNSAADPIATPIGAGLTSLALDTARVDSSSDGATLDKGASPTEAVAPPAAPPVAQVAVKSSVRSIALANTREDANHVAGATAAAGDGVASKSSTADSGSSATSPNVGVDVTSQTTLAATMAAAATSLLVPSALSLPLATTSATPATGVAPTVAADLAAPVAIDAALPASAAVAASVAQVVIGAGQLSAADKHSHAPASDKALTSVGNQGAVEFAQLVSTSPSTDAAPTNLKVAAAVDSPQFAQGVGNQVQVMVDNGLNTAKLQVNPASLGPIEVRIAIQNGHAQVWMTSHSAVTRDALESSTPQLKDMLGSQGFSQVSVDISQRSFQERTPQPHSYDWQPRSAEDDAAPIQSGTVSAARGGGSSSVVDAYA